ncbi:rCG62919 [Rattus norvegicus]|uniref:RCG62919 n=1 Tax=Rattus norvegicus TaxID=10116 RepID=A6I3L4_RAT|nr:rCG62919 [Rattus norvegicus]
MKKSNHAEQLDTSNNTHCETASSIKTKSEAEPKPFPPFSFILDLGPANILNHGPWDSLSPCQDYSAQKSLKEEKECWSIKPTDKVQRKGGGKVSQEWCFLVFPNSNSLDLWEICSLLSPG